MGGFVTKIPVGGPGNLELLCLRQTVSWVDLWGRCMGQCCPAALAERSRLTSLVGRNRLSAMGHKNLNRKTRSWLFRFSGRNLLTRAAVLFFLPRAFFRSGSVPGHKGCHDCFFRRLASSHASAVFMEASTLTCKALPGRQAGHIRGIPDARQQVTDVGAGPVKVAKARRRQASQALSKS